MKRTLKSSLDYQSFQKASLLITQRFFTQWRRVLSHQLISPVNCSLNIIKFNLKPS